MNIDMTRSFEFTFCTIDDVTAIAVQKSRCVAESFSAGLETEYRFQIGLESWGDNKVDNNAGGDNKVDNNRSRVDNKVVNIAPRTTAPCNTRTTRWLRIGRRLPQRNRGSTSRSAHLSRGVLVAAYNFVAPQHGMEGG